MKKILLSCVTCLLALGLVTACSNDDEEKDDGTTSVPSGDTGGEEEGDGTTSKEATYKLGAFDETNYEYVYFDGSASTTSNGTFLHTSSGWENGVDITISDAGTTSEEVSVSLSFTDETGSTKYIASLENSTNVTMEDEPCIWHYDEENTVFVSDTSERCLVLYSNGSIRAYQVNENNLSNPHVHAFSAKPADPELPTMEVELEVVTSITSDSSYYIGSFDGSTYHLLTGEMSGYNLATSINFSEAAEVVISGDETDGYKLSIGEKYIYGYVSSTFFDLGLSSEETVPNSGVNLFKWSSEINGFYTDQLSTSTYSLSYLEYYNGAVALYGTSDLASASSVASVFQVVETGD